MVNVRFVLILAAGAFLLSCGGNQGSTPVTVPIAIEADPATKAAVEALLESNPTVVDTETGTSYRMLIVKPKPGERYSVIHIQPDPNEKYSIIIIDPTTGKQTSTMDPGASQALSEAIKKRLPEAESGEAE